MRVYNSSIHMKISSAATRAVLKEGIPSILYVLRKGTDERKKRLEDCEIVKCAPGEKVVNAQRQHPITFLGPLIAQLGIAIFILLVAYFFYIFYDTPTLYFYSRPILMFMILTVIATLLLFEIFNFLSWYYQFYVITNKAIVHRRSFRIGGEYSEEVYAEEMHVQEVVTMNTNPLYDFLKIQDVYVYFHKLEREEPFIFRMPEDAQIIDDIIQGLIVESRHTL